jgi:glutamate synthase (NADPH/NADH) small chain
VTQLEIMPRLPDQRGADNPWPEWPKIHKVDYGQEEAQARFGSDPRVYLTTATRFEGDSTGRVSAVHTVEVEWKKGDDGRLAPIPVPGSERVRPASLVLLAMGFLGPEPELPRALGVELDPRTNIKAEFGRYATSVEGVFAAGDCRRGQSLVVWAINEGRAAARECDRFLMGSTSLP